MEKTIIATPQFERTGELDFEYIPKTEAEFIDTVTNAPLYILKGLGFCFWEKINTIIEENSNKPEHESISIPAINLDGSDAGEITFDIGYKNNPVVKQSVDEEIWLIPGEWYNIIPDGFILTSITGREEKFKKGVTDDDIRFGCLAFGVKRRVES